MYGVKITVIGKVSGLSFREKTRQKAEELSLTGWIKNNETKEVVIYAEGTMENLIALSNWCQIGSKNSEIDKVSIEWREKIEKDFIEFNVHK